eukprot:Rmarinus@m.18477
MKKAKVETNEMKSESTQLIPLQASAHSLSARLRSLKFGPPVSVVYNPLEYAQVTHNAYLSKFGSPGKEVVFMGMNPGPFGMCQTGVPFGQVDIVREWMGISGAIGQPTRIHPQRPIEGFQCKRQEVSGQRLWGWIREVWGTAEAFFQKNFVYNYCPLAFMESSGKNRTPADMRGPSKDFLLLMCDDALADCLRWFRPQFVVGIGKFAHERLRRVCARMVEEGEFAPHVMLILHPSPANPAANRDWAGTVTAQLRDQFKAYYESMAYLPLGTVVAEEKASALADDKETDVRQKQTQMQTQKQTTQKQTQNQTQKQATEERVLRLTPRRRKRCLETAGEEGASAAKKPRQDGTHVDEALGGHDDKPRGGNQIGQAKPRCSAVSKDAMPVGGETRRMEACAAHTEKDYRQVSAEHRASVVDLAAKVGVSLQNLQERK